MGSPVQSFDPLAGDPPSRHPAWRPDIKTLGLIALATFVLLALIGLASAVDLSALRSNEIDESGSDAAANAGSSSNGQSFGTGSSGGAGGGAQGGAGNEGGNGAPFGDGPAGRIDLGPGADGAELEVRPIPWCPDGFQIGEDILVIPDPEACGLERVPPGTEGFESGMRILVPDIDGDIGGFRIGSDGDVGLVAPEELRNDDVVVWQLPDGSFELRRPDGSRVEIAPGDNGLDLRDPGSGNRFVPNPDIGSNAPGLQDPGGQGGEPSEPPTASTDDDRETDFDGLQTLLLLVVIAALLGLVALGIKNVLASQRDAEPDDDLLEDQDSLDDDVADYSTEINALDRLLWEIDQESDPRTAIRRVYAALETGLDNPAMARRRSETPGIYVRRVLGHFDELTLPLNELTALFERARFSEHEITPDMRNRAVESLLAVRSHYATQSSLADAEAELTTV